MAVPAAARPGAYELQISILAKHSDEPVVKLAVAGVDSEGWYPMGPVEVVGG